MIVFNIISGPSGKRREAPSEPTWFGSRGSRRSTLDCSLSGVALDAPPRSMGVERARRTKFVGSSEGELVRPLAPCPPSELALRDLGMAAGGFGFSAIIEIFARDEDLSNRSLL